MPRYSISNVRIKLPLLMDESEEPPKRNICLSGQQCDMGSSYMPWMAPGPFQKMSLLTFRVVACRAPRLNSHFARCN